MEREDIVRIAVGVLIILFGFFIIAFELLFTTDTGLRLFTTQLVSVLIVLAGILLIIFTLRDWPKFNEWGVNFPLHYPYRWPVGLVVYILLLFTASIGLNWYGYLAWPVYGNALVIAFFIMVGSYSYYQYTYNKKKGEARPKAKGK